MPVKLPRNMVTDLVKWRGSFGYFGNIMLQQGNMKYSTNYLYFFPKNYHLLSIANFKARKTGLLTTGIVSTISYQFPSFVLYNL